MEKLYTESELKKFESIIGDKFNNKEIRSPIHLSDGNEKQIIDIFSDIDIDNDWVCCTWRNHYQCLLKGVPEDILIDKIISGKSMVINLPEYKIVTSSIVGGIPSIAVGIAYSIKLKSEKSHVWCWLGDMSAETGNFHEALKYAENFDLPITFVVEDNGLSVTSPTNDVWGNKTDFSTYKKIRYYTYKNELYPHAGAGIKVVF